MMSEQEKWDYIIELDEKYLLGGVILSEWSTLLAKDAETAFCSGANLSAILSAQASIESHLRYEYFNSIRTKGWSFNKLLLESNFPNELLDKLHVIRKYRNKWVHVADPLQDDELLSKPEYYENELEEMAKLSIELMLRVLYSEQFI